MPLSLGKRRVLVAVLQALLALILSLTARPKPLRSAVLLTMFGLLGPGMGLAERLWYVQIDVEDEVAAQRAHWRQLCIHAENAAERRIMKIRRRIKQRECFARRELRAYRRRLLKASKKAWRSVRASIMRLRQMREAEAAT